MKFRLLVAALVVSLCSTLPSTSQDEPNDNLGAVLKSTGWDVLLGTWLNPEGEEFTFTWRYPEATLLMEAEVGGIKRSSIYVKRAKSETVNAFAFDSEGSSSVGTCTFSKGIAQFVMNTYMPDTGEMMEMKFKYTLTGENSFEAKMEGSDYIYKYTRK